MLPLVFPDDHAGMGGTIIVVEQKESLDIRVCSISLYNKVGYDRQIKIRKRSRPEYLRNI